MVGMLVAIIVIILWLIAVGYLVGKGWRLANR